MKVNSKITQSGRSMVEMMGYMVVVLTVIAAIGNLVNHAYEEFKYSKASLQVSELAASIVKASAVEGYGAIVSKVNSAEGIKIIPKSYRVVGNKIYHAFGGTVEVSQPEGDNTRFVIKFNKLNHKQCVELAMKEWQNNKSVDLYELVVNNHYWYWSVYSNVGGGDNALPVKRSVVAGTESANGQCNENNNSIMWIFN